MRSTRATLFWRGGAAGALAGLAAAAVMELLALGVGLKTLPDLLQGPLLGLLPGPVFGFLIDTLQHLGKVLEEAGLLLAMVLALGALGAAAAVAEARLPRWRPGVVVAAAGWLALTGLSLADSAAGPLTVLAALNSGAWALVMAAWYWLWHRLLQRREGRDEVDLQRRRMALLFPAGLALLSLAVIGGLRVPEWLHALAGGDAPPGPVPALTPVSDFYRVSKNLRDPVVVESGWSLRLFGQVGRELKLDLAHLRALPQSSEVVTMECVSNLVGGNLMSTGRFTGIPLRDLLTMTEPSADARSVTYRAQDGFSESLPLNLVLADPRILIALQLNGQPLGVEHGFPARVLIPGRYGMKGPKWLKEIELTSTPQGGYWEEQGWDREAIVRTTARFDVPLTGSSLLSPVQLAGVAFAGVRGVNAVEWSADGGRSWHPAELEAPLSELTWTRWRATWRPAQDGAYTLLVRARDGSGEAQTSQEAPSFPKGASGYHRLQVRARPVG
ncbi:MAG: molybdopterin-dependent oxidoreductase [Candidatus Dormibacteraeota bacterium]|nr:molybdopterin-dependent oxidoreductase [Candidatus Dormibacteraeota bacterium]